MFRVTAFARAAGVACLAASLSFLPNQSAQAGDGYGSRPHSWTGFYVGAHGSYNWFDQEFPGAAPHPKGPPRMELSGGMLGGQVGAQYHFKGGLLVGIEADYSRGNLNQTVKDGNFITQTGDIDWTGTLRARVGLPMGAWLPYVTAGYMWAGASYNQACPEKAVAIPVSPGSHCAKADKYSVTKDQTHGGFVYGGGLEWAVSNNFSVKAEGLWFRLKEETYEMGAAPLSGVAIGNKPIEYDGAMFRIGGNYRF